MGIHYSIYALLSAITLIVVYVDCKRYAKSLEDET